MIQIQIFLKLIINIITQTFLMLIILNILSTKILDY